MNLLKMFKGLKNCGFISAFGGLFSGGTVGIIWAIIQPFVINSKESARVNYKAL